MSLPLQVKTATLLLSTIESLEANTRHSLSIDLTNVPYNEGGEDCLFAFANVTLIGPVSEGILCRSLAQQAIDEDRPRYNVLRALNIEIENTTDEDVELEGVELSISGYGMAALPSGYTREANSSFTPSTVFSATLKDGVGVAVASSWNTTVVGATSGDGSIKVEDGDGVSVVDEATTLRFPNTLITEIAAGKAQIQHVIFVDSEDDIPDDLPAGVLVVISDSDAVATLIPPMEITSDYTVSSFNRLYSRLVVRGASMSSINITLPSSSVAYGLRLVVVNAGLGDVTVNGTFIDPITMTVISSQGVMKYETLEALGIYLTDSGSEAPPTGFLKNGVAYMGTGRYVWAFT